MVTAWFNSGRNHQYLVKAGFAHGGTFPTEKRNIIVMDPKTGISQMTPALLSTQIILLRIPKTAGEILPSQILMSRVPLSNCHRCRGTGKSGQSDRFYDPGISKSAKKLLSAGCRETPRQSDFTEGVENSCNPVFVEVGLRLEEKEKNLFYKYIKAFGFGEPTGIDLFGEAKGILIPEDKLKLINIGTISIGQGIAVTPLQLITAVAAVANGGYLLQPRLVKEIRDSEGRLIEEMEPRTLEQVISRETAKSGLNPGRRGQQGTGRNAYIPGFRVGGKTGTAQKPEKGGYQPSKYVASFVGLAPVNDPRLVALVVIDEPQGCIMGTIGSTSFPASDGRQPPLFGSGTPVQLHRRRKAGRKGKKQVAVPDVINLPPEQARAALGSQGSDPLSRAGPCGD